VEFTSRAVAGRAPQAPDGWAGATLVVIDDPDRTVSKTHAGFTAEGDAVFVTDLDSTNGVAIVTSDGEEIILEPGQPTRVPDGADVELGSFAVRVTRA
jgi:pSer/pThr/pTyr-binding forkhead associated (FHA) protein